MTGRFTEDAVLAVKAVLAGILESGSVVVHQAAPITPEELARDISKRVLALIPEDRYVTPEIGQAMLAEAGYYLAEAILVDLRNERGGHLRAVE